MKRWALIKNNSVVNVVEQANAPEVAGLWVLCDPSIGPGALWQNGAFAALPAPLPPPRNITRTAFRQRFTHAEKVNIEMLALDNPASPMPQRLQSATLRVYLADLSDAVSVHLDLPLTRDSVITLEAGGVIAPGRAAMILDTPVDDLERPT